jgi:hypothetical protein
MNELLVRTKSWRHPWLTILRGCDELITGAYKILATPLIDYFEGLWWINYWRVQNPGDTPDWLFSGVVMNELLVRTKSWRHPWLNILRGCNEWITGAYKILATPLIDYFERLTRPFWCWTWNRESGWVKKEPGVLWSWWYWPLLGGQPMLIFASDVWVTIDINPCKFHICR